MERSMFSEREVIGLQAEKHELVVPEAARTPEERNLFLIHETAYRRVARLRERGARRQSKWHRLKAALGHTRLPEPAAELTLADLEQYSSAAFRYRARDLERSLDLIAVCTP